MNHESESYLTGSSVVGACGIPPAFLAAKFQKGEEEVTPHWEVLVGEVPCRNGAGIGELVSL